MICGGQSDGIPIGFVHFDMFDIRIRLLIHWKATRGSPGENLLLVGDVSCGSGWTSEIHD